MHDARCALLAFVLLLAATMVLPLRGSAQAGGQGNLDAAADQVTADVESLRGWSFKHKVARERVDAQGVRQYLQQQLALALPPARRPLVEAFLKTAGLIPADCDPVATFLQFMDQQVAGYYDPPTQKLYLVNRPDAMPESMQRAVLAHELTHALDDQELGLGKMTDPRAVRTEDAATVAMSLSEGSAMSLMLHYVARQVATGGIDAGELASYFGREMERARALEQAPPYFNAQFGSYVIGAAFLARGDLQAVLRLPDDRAIGENLSKALASLPRSSEQVLHPEKYWNEAQRDEPIVIDDHAAERWLRRPGRQVIHRDTLGELMTALYTQPRDAVKDPGKLMSAAAWTNAGAAGWGGDRFFLLASGPSEEQAARDLKNLQAVWVTAWDTPGECAEFVRALDRGTAPARSTVVTRARVAIVFIGIDAAEREALMQSFDKSPLPFLRESFR